VATFRRPVSLTLDTPRIQMVAGLAFLALSACSGSSSCCGPIVGPTSSPPPRQASTLYVGAAEVPGRLLSLPATSKGSVSPTTLIQGSLPDLAYNYFVAIDASDRLWATNCLNLAGSSGPVVAFEGADSGNVAPMVSIGGSSTGLSGCQTGIFVDGSGNVYVGDIANTPAYPGGQVAVFGSGQQGNVAPVRRIAGTNAGFHSPTGVALDGSGKLYVADSGLGYHYTGDVHVFAAGATGNVSPIASIAGSKTGILTPEGVAIDSSGNIYVGNLGNASVTVYRAGANGNVAPIRRIAGSKTQLDAVSDVAVDAAGYLYVGNQDAGKNAPVLVFAPNANGNAAPVQSITIDASQFGKPAGVAVR
jgi:hypothetical protein